MGQIGLSGKPVLGLAKSEMRGAPQGLAGGKPEDKPATAQMNAGQMVPINQDVL